MLLSGRVKFVRISKTAGWREGLLHQNYSNVLMLVGLGQRVTSGFTSSTSVQHFYIQNDTCTLQCTGSRDRQKSWPNKETMYMTQLVCHQGSNLPFS